MRSFDGGVGGILELYEDRIVIKRKGLISFMAHGLKGDKTIYYNNLTSVQFKKGNYLVNGYIQFSIKGGNESRGGAFAATSDENTIMITVQKNDEAEEVVEYINNKLAEINNRAFGNVTQAVSPAEELKKFKELLDMGIITQAEFDAKKKQLLGL